MATTSSSADIHLQEIYAKYPDLPRANETLGRPEVPEFACKYLDNYDTHRAFGSACAGTMIIAIIFGFFALYVHFEDVKIEDAPGTKLALIVFFGIFFTISIICGAISAHSNPKPAEKSAYERWVLDSDINTARNLETAARFEDAAKIYEKHKMYDDAGRARTKQKTQIVQQVSLDLNSLIQQMREGGIVTTYKCPNCNASIQITGITTVEVLQKCQYCGTAFAVQDIASFIQKVLQAPMTTSQPRIQKIFCPQCGFENQGTNKFCKKCGASLTG